jgi:integrase
MKPSTCNRKLSALRGVFSRAAQWNVLLTPSPLAAIKKQRESSGKVRYLASDERARLFKALDGHEAAVRAECAATARNVRRITHATPDAANADYLKPAVITALNTGLRLTEMLSLEWVNVDLERAVITITDESTKSSKQRHIPINRELLAVLIAWKPQADKRYVFAGVDGQPLARIPAWNSLPKAAELVDFRWHDIRHDFASRLVIAGVAINTVRDLLGHADIKMTLRYAHLSPNCRAAAVEMLCAHDGQAAQPDRYTMAA